MQGCGFDLWVGKIPWKRKWQPTPVFLPGEFRGQRSPEGYSPWGRKRVRYDLVTMQQQTTRDSLSGQTVKWGCLLLEITARIKWNSVCKEMGTILPVSVQWLVSTAELWTLCWCRGGWWTLFEPICICTSLREGTLLRWNTERVPVSIFLEPWLMNTWPDSHISHANLSEQNETATSLMALSQRTHTQL